MIIAMKNLLLSTWNRRWPYMWYNDSPPYANRYEGDRFIIKRRNDVVGIKTQPNKEVFMNWEHSKYNGLDSDLIVYKKDDAINLSYRLSKIRHDGCLL